MNQHSSTAQSIDRGKEFLESITLDDQVLSNYSEIEDRKQVRSAENFRDDVDKHINGGEITKGDRLPFDKTRDIRFRDHEVTVWTGYNGSYKSMFLGQVALGFISQQRSVCIASPEMAPKVTLARMLYQFSGTQNLPDEYIEKFYNTMANKLYLYDQPNGIIAENLLKVIRYCRIEMKINHFMIDSLMKCGINGDDYNKQKWFVNELCTIAKDTGIHIHLVAHQKKPQQGKHDVNRYDIAGSGDISNLVDNVIICYRNYNEDKSYTNGINIDKQRHYAGGDHPEPKYVFWMDKSLQFMENELGPVNTPQIWVNL